MGIPDDHEIEDCESRRQAQGCQTYRVTTRRCPPGRHGPGNNLFVFIQDCDGNKIELSAELEIVRSRQLIDWPHEARTLNLWGDALMRS